MDKKFVGIVQKESVDDFHAMCYVFHNDVAHIYIEDADGPYTHQLIFYAGEVRLVPFLPDTSPIILANLANPKLIYSTKE